MEDNYDEAVTLTSGDMTCIEMVDEIVEKSLINGDINKPLMYGKSLKRNMQASGLALAKLLTRMEDNWENYKKSGGVDDEFVDTIHASLGLSVGTITKYTGMWRAVFDNPDIDPDIKQQLLGKPMRSLILLKAGVEEGSINPEDAAKTISTAEMRELVRASRGLVGTANSAILIGLNVRNGELSCKQGAEPWELFGRFLPDTSPIAAKAIERIVRYTGIMQL